MQAHGTACVTGAGRGIGRALALELAARGFRVQATLRDTGLGDALIAEAAGRGGRLDVVRLDVTAPGDYAPPADLRVLVHNAGVDTASDAAEATPLDAWRRVFETNVFGAVELTRRAIPRLRAAGGGVIVNVTSASLLVPMPFFGVYRASKAALAAHGESLRSELAPHGIRVLEVLPGAIETDMLAGSPDRPEAARHAAYRAQAELVEARRRAGAGTPTSPADAARAIADAILDDDATGRVACDPMGEALLAAAHGAGARAREAAFVAAFDPRRAR